MAIAFTGGGSGSANWSDAATITANAMGALAVDVAMALNTKTIAADQTITFSGSPSAYQRFDLLVTNSDSASHVLTLPVAATFYSTAQNATITTVTVPASGKVLLTFEFTGGTAYNIYGDPVPASYTVGTRPTASAAGAGASIMIADSTYGIYGPIVSDGTRWRGGRFMLSQTVPVLLTPTSTINNGASGNITLGTGIHASSIYSEGMWMYLNAVASTPAITAGYYYVVMSSATLGTVYTNGPGSAAFNFSGGPYTMTASTGSDKNLLYLDQNGQTAPSTTGFQVPAGILGTHGMIRYELLVSVNNTAGNKIFKPRVGGQNLYTQTVTTVTGHRGVGWFKNSGVTGKNKTFGVTTTAGWQYNVGSGAAGVQTNSTVDTSAAMNLDAIAQVATATDWVMVETASIEILLP